MDAFERKNVIYRLVSAALLLTDIGLAIFSLIMIFKFEYNDVILSVITIILTGLFAVAQAIFIVSGWKKESNLYKILFNENKKVNTAPLIAVIVGTIFSLILLILSIVLWQIKINPKDLISALVIMCVSLYLLVNCGIYYFYLYLFKDRPINLKDFIK